MGGKITTTSPRRVEWQCYGERCGYRWIGKRLCDRLFDPQCPVCASFHVDEAQRERVEWRCDECGYKWTGQHYGESGGGTEEPRCLACGSYRVRISS